MNASSGPGSLYGAFPPNVLELSQRQLSQFGRVGSTKVYRTPAVAAFTGISSPSNIRFREPGTVIACYGQSSLGTVAEFAQMEVRVQIGGQEDIVTDGQSGTFAPMLALFGPNLNWFPLWRRAIPGIDWTVTYNNNSLATGTPSFLLAFVADADVLRNSPARQ